MYFPARSSALFEMLPYIPHPSFDNDACVTSFELSGIPSGGISGGGISGGDVCLRGPDLSYLTCVQVPLSILSNVCTGAAAAGQNGG